eukprot:jgi/Botrbrau1/429/Bobra.110_2s0079.1
MRDVSGNLPLKVSEIESCALQHGRKAGAPSSYGLMPHVPISYSSIWSPKVSANHAVSNLARNLEGVSASWSLPLALLWKIRYYAAFYSFGTPYSNIAGHRARDLIPEALRDVKSDLSSTTGESGATEENPQQSSSSPDQHTLKLVMSLAADLQPFYLRIFGLVLSPLFKWLYNFEVFVDVVGAKRLRSLSETHTLVYIPTHKSHVDYMMLSFVMFAFGLPVPHIAAGSNLQLPIIGEFLRRCGAFYIRRSIRGARDGELYKTILAGYLRALLKAGLPMEFFIEGGRSREGSIGTPRLGLLSYVVDAVLDESLPKRVALVPVAISYDMPVEESGMMAELAGRPKKKESLWGLCKAVWNLMRGSPAGSSEPAQQGTAAPSLGTPPPEGILPGAGGAFGCSIVSFGTPIDIEEFLGELPEASDCNVDNLAACFPKAGAARRNAVASLGEAVTAGLRSTYVVPASTLLVVAALNSSLAAIAGSGGGTEGCTAESAVHADAHLQGCEDGEQPLSPTSSVTSAEESFWEACEDEARYSETPDMACGEVPSRWAGMGSLLEVARWLADETEARGMKCMRLNGGGAPCTAVQLAVNKAQLVSTCLDLDKGVPDASSVRVRPAMGWEARLHQQYRLNQLLPVWATEALLAAVLLAPLSGESPRGSRPAPSPRGPSTPPATSTLSSLRGSNPGPDQYLRNPDQRLAPGETAVAEMEGPVVGTSASADLGDPSTEITGKAASELESGTEEGGLPAGEVVAGSAVAAGSVVRRHGLRGGEPGPEGARCLPGGPGLNGPAPHAGKHFRSHRWGALRDPRVSPHASVRIAEDPAARGVAEFAAGLLKPALATYASALPLAVKALSEAPGLAMSGRDLIRFMQRQIIAGRPLHPAALPSLTLLQGALAAFRRLGVVKQADVQGTEEETELASGPPGPHQTFLAHVESSRMFAQPCIAEASSGNDAKTGSLSDSRKSDPPSPVQREAVGSPRDNPLHPSTPPQLHEGTGGTRERPEESPRSPTSPTATRGPSLGSVKTVARAPSLSSNPSLGSKKGSKERLKTRAPGNIGGLQVRDNELLELGEEYRNEAALAELVLRIERYIIG